MSLLGLHRWRSQTRVMRVVRWLLTVWVVLGLTPLGDAAGHLLQRAESLAETTTISSHDTSGSHETEHGCTPSQHHCKCCSSQSMLPPDFSLPSFLAMRPVATKVGVADVPAPWSRAVSPLLRPPIA